MSEQELLDSKAVRVIDLLEQIKSVSQMVALHEGDDFMIDQYQYRKQLFLQELKELLADYNILPEDLAA